MIVLYSRKAGVVMKTDKDTAASAEFLNVHYFWDCAGEAFLCSAGSLVTRESRSKATNPLCHHRPLKQTHQAQDQEPKGFLCPMFSTVIPLCLRLYSAHRQDIVITFLGIPNGWAIGTLEVSDLRISKQTLHNHQLLENSLIIPVGQTASLISLFC